jgi:hypothetical protein
VTEYQWGVRTEYADGSGDIEWSNEDEARGFLAYYAVPDAHAAMKVRSRELVRRPIVPGHVEAVESDYAERRQAAENRAKACAPYLTAPETNATEGGNRS